MHQLLRSSKLRFDLNFGDLGKWLMYMYVELVSCCWGWSFNKHWFESVLISSSIPHKFTNAHNMREATKIFCLCKFFIKHLEHTSKSSSICIESTSKCMLFVQTTCSLQLYSNFHTKWQLVLINFLLAMMMRSLNYESKLKYGCQLKKTMG
jgi:hypothetical protein